MASIVCPLLSANNPVMQSVSFNRCKNYYPEASAAVITQNDKGLYLKDLSAESKSTVCKCNSGLSTFDSLTVGKKLTAPGPGAWFKRVVCSLLINHGCVLAVTCNKPPKSLVFVHLSVTLPHFKTNTTLGTSVGQVSAVSLVSLMVNFHVALLAQVWQQDILCSLA